MGLRDTLNNNSAVVTIGAVALLVIALGIMLMSGGRGSASGEIPKEKYFYDVKEKKLFTVPISTLSPTTAPSGGEGVEAHVMTCADSCGGKDLSGMTAEEVEQAGLFISHLEKLSDAAIKRMEELRAKNPDMPGGMRPMMGPMGMDLMMDANYRLLSEERWFPMNHPRFMQMQQELKARCPNRPYPKRCFPGTK